MVPSLGMCIRVREKTIYGRVRKAVEPKSNPVIIKPLAKSGEDKNSSIHGLGVVMSSSGYVLQSAEHLFSERIIEVIRIIGHNYQEFCLETSYPN